MNNAKWLKAIVEKLFYYGGLTVIFLIAGSFFRFIDNSLSVEQVERGGIILLAYFVVAVAHFYLQKVK
ncbi:hypothetical protein RCC89_13555 [Cytophagaceae bacterium ABcell3]|nr:hypothetical protein RCC89_13555 [Cytophagaceae bacterium ABcell3]